MKSVLEQLAEFVKDAEGRMAQSLWLSDDLMQVYVRRGFRHLEGAMRVSLDIANVEVYEQNQGTFSDFFWKAHEMNPWDCTYVECVHNNFLAAWLLKNGLTPTDTLESYYLQKDVEKWKTSSRSSRTSTPTTF